jgi:glycerophosphoryl diester phosphodiesterase
MSLTSVRIKSIRIGGAHAHAFNISKDHKLTIRKEKLQADMQWVDILVTVATSAGKIEDTFRIVRDDFIRNKVIAHRGAWKNTRGPENSLAALQHAIRMGCEGSEFDVHMSSDSVPFINHDPAIQGISIAQATSFQLSGITLDNGEPLPTLQNYLEAGIRQNKTKLILEIKASQSGKAASLALTRKVIAMVEGLHAQAWVDFISFDYQVCKEIMKIAPYAKVAYLMGDKTPAELLEDNFFGLDYHFSILQKNPDWIKEAQQKRLTVNVWTVNDQTVMEGLLKENVDFITTNEPELLLNLISNK